MRITMSDGYEYDPCGDQCDRAYCPMHRLLWRYCETAKAGIDDTYLDGRGHYVYEWGDCPKCEKEYQHKRDEAFIRNLQARANR